MREYTTAPTFVVGELGSLTDDVVRNAAEHPDTVIASRPVDGEWEGVTAAEFHQEVRSVAKGLVAAGIEVGDRVALLSRTRYEWTLVDYAIWYVGAVTVPIYESSSAEQVGWILSDSDAAMAVVETSGHVERVESMHDRTPRLRHLLCLNRGDLGSLVTDGSAVTDEELDERRAQVTPASTATLIYTSGTTGRPKGCVLTHANFMVELGVTTQILDELFDLEDASTLLFLPLAHVFARVIQVGCIRRRVRLGHSAEVKNLLDDLASFRPTFVLAVPRVFEKVFNTASQQAAADGRGKVFDAATTTAITYSQALDRSGPGPLLRARRAVFDRLVYSRLRDALGGRTQYAVSGGAPLGERLAHFYRGVGIPVLEGYGLTESTAALTVNLPDALRVGTVGRPLPGVSVRVADDGELQFRGGQVFQGYWRNPEATAKVLVDGWLHTGDVGEVDDEGFVRITGRKKEILVTAGGKNVAPAVLEDRIRAHPLISQCMVVGDGRPFVGALITLDPEAVGTWAGAHGKAADADELRHDPAMLAEVQQAIDDANTAVSKAEAIRKFAIVAGDWTEDGGQLTPTLKLKRTVVMSALHEEVESLYM